jgi:hypothetical protein
VPPRLPPVSGWVVGLWSPPVLIGLALPAVLLGLLELLDPHDGRDRSD